MLEYFGALYSRWVRVRVRFRDDPIGRNSRGDRDGAAEVLRRRNRCCGCFGRGRCCGCFGRRLLRLYRDVQFPIWNP